MECPNYPDSGKKKNKTQQGRRAEADRSCFVNSLPRSLTAMGNLQMDGFNKKLLVKF